MGTFAIQCGWHCIQWYSGNNRIIYGNAQTRKKILQIFNHFKIVAVSLKTFYWDQYFAPLIWSIDHVDRCLIYYLYIDGLIYVILFWCIPTLYYNDCFNCLLFMIRLALCSAFLTPISCLFVHLLYFSEGKKNKSVFWIHKPPVYTVNSFMKYWYYWWDLSSCSIGWGVRDLQLQIYGSLVRIQSGAVSSLIPHCRRASWSSFAGPGSLLQKTGLKPNI